MLLLAWLSLAHAGTYTDEVGGTEYWVPLEYSEVGNAYRANAAVELTVVEADLWYSASSAGLASLTVRTRTGDKAEWEIVTTSGVFMVEDTKGLQPFTLDPAVRVEAGEDVLLTLQAGSNWMFVQADTDKGALDTVWADALGYTTRATDGHPPGWSPLQDELGLHLRITVEAADDDSDGVDSLGDCDDTNPALTDDCDTGVDDSGDTGSGDTGANDSGDSGETEDSAETEDTGDSGGDPPDTDSGLHDTGVASADDDAAKEGCGCGALGSKASPLGALAWCALAPAYAFTRRPQPPASRRGPRPAER